MNKSITLNTFYQILTKIVTVTSTLLFNTLIINSLGGATFGEYSIVLNYVLFFYVISDFGFNAILINDFNNNKKHAKRNFKNVIFLRIFHGSLVTLICLAILSLFQYSSSLKFSIILTSPLIILYSINKAFELIFQSFSKYKYLLISTVVGSITYITIALYIIKSFTVQLNELVILYSIGIIFTTITSGILSRSYITKHKKQTWLKEYKRVLFKTIPIGSMLIINTFLTQIDRLMLSVMVAPIQVGYYTLAYRIFEVSLVFPTFLMNAFYPHALMSKQYKKLFKQIIIWLSSFSILITILIVFVSKPLILIIWGPEMLPSQFPLQLLGYSLTLFYLSSPLSWLFIIENKKHYLPFIYSVALIFNIISNVKLIPKYGINAAAITTGISELIVVSLLLIFYFYGYKMKGVRRYILRL